MKKLLSLVLAIAMLLSIAPMALAEDGADVFRYDKQITLKVSVFDRGTTGNSPADNNDWTAWIQENFGDPRNIKIEWVVIPRSEEVDKLNILMASGDAADICFTYTKAVVMNFVKQGGLYELTDYINQYGQNLKAYLGEEILSNGVYAGGQYAIPAKRVVQAKQGMFIREDWLEKLGMEMPTTKEEFYNVLVAFRDQNPAGVENVIPYACSSSMTGHTPLLFSFIKDLSDKNLATVPDIMWDGYEDYVLFLNKLYNEGLVSPDFALNNDEMLFGEVTSGRAGGYTYNYDHPIRVTPGILTSLQEFEPDAKLSPLNCFESVTDPTKYYHDAYNPAGLQCFVPIFSKHPEAAVMYLDWLTDLDVIYYLQNGVEGVHHELNEDGLPIVKDVQGSGHFNSMQNLDYTLLTNGQEFSDPEKKIQAQALSYQGHEDLFEEIYIVGNTDPLVNEYHFDTVLEQDAKYNTSLSAMKTEIVTKCVMAKPDECLDLFYKLRQEYMDNGGTAVMEEKIQVWEKMYGDATDI